MDADDKTKHLEAALKKIIEEAKRNPSGSVEGLRQIAREALEKIGIKD